MFQQQQYLYYKIYYNSFMELKHQAKLIIVGGSIGITIPKLLLSQINADVGDMIDIEFSKGGKNEF